jgi:hypothetical protein
MRAAMHKSFFTPGGRFPAAWLTRVTGGESPGPFGTNELGGHLEPRGPLMSPGFWETLQRIAAKRRALPEPSVPPTGFEPVPPP